MLSRMGCPHPANDLPSPVCATPRVRDACYIFVRLSVLVCNFAVKEVIGVGSITKHIDRQRRRFTFVAILRRDSMGRNFADACLARRLGTG